MQLTFLSAAVPLTKTIAFSARSNSYTVTSYPMVRNMTSEAVDVANMDEFAYQLQQFAQRGWCLLKGELERPIIDEPRAGLANNKLLHDWVCFDFDKVECPPTMEGAVEALYKYLPECTHDVDAVIQLSASCFHPQARKLSAHVFMRLRRAVDSAMLRDWFLHINLEGPAAKELRLSDSGRALSYPIDVSVSSPAKLLYIAPPRTIGYVPDLQDPIQVLPGEQRTFELPAFNRVATSRINDEINRLRAECMMDPYKYETKLVGGQEFFTDEEELTVHDMKVSASGHLRFNVNGGDSMAYYIDTSRPNVIGNFKGEPFMHTNLVAPKLFDQLKRMAPSANNTVRISEATEVLAFYATNRGSAVHIGTFDREHDVLRIERSTTEAAYSWLRELGAPLKSNLPHYDLIFDISSNIRYEPGYPVINLYARTKFLKLYGDIERTLAVEDALERLGKECPTFGKLLKSVCGDDSESLKRYLNWLAYIFQTRTKPGSAWLFHGTEGTGKGFMLRFILKPLFGDDNVDQMLMVNVASSFNSILEGKLIVNIDEADMSKTHDPVEIMAKLRNWITEDKIVINEKHRVEESVKSFVSFIVTANTTRPVMIPHGDRRWNVAPRQETRIEVFPNEMAILEQGEELPMFAKLLGELVVDEEWLRNPLNNEAKKILFESTHGLPDAVAAAIREGNTSFFFAARPSDTQMALGKTVLPISEYDALLRAMASKTLTVLSTADLYVLFKVAINNDKQFSDNTTQQRKLFRRLGFGENKPLYCARAKKTVYGVPAPVWEPVSDEFSELLEKLNIEPSGKVVGIRSRQQ